MSSRITRGWAMVGVLCLSLSGAGPIALAQETPPQPVVIVGNTQFTALFEDVVLMPGERAERDLDVGGFARVSLLAAADAGVPAMGRVAVNAAFGPPPVPVDNRLVLPFAGGAQARGHATHPVMGPRLHVAAVNNSNQRVTFNLGVYAVK